MSNLPEFLETVLRLLHHSQVDFVLVGGAAMILHGSNAVTFDVDISFAADEENCEKICQIINPHHPRPLAFPPNSQFTVTPGLLGRVKFLNLKTDLGAIDLLPLPDGVDSFEGLRSRADVKPLGDFSVPVACIADLIAMKRAANRTKDQLHVMELLALQRILDETPPENKG